MWLPASYGNHDPGWIATYFQETVSGVGGYPRCVRTDCGTENVTIAAIQSFVTNSTSSHLHRSPPWNQCIEKWWSFFHRSRSQWWIQWFG